VRGRWALAAAVAVILAADLVAWLAFKAGPLDPGPQHLARWAAAIGCGYVGARRETGMVGFLCGVGLAKAAAVLAAFTTALIYAITGTVAARGHGPDALFWFVRDALLIAALGGMAGAAAGTLAQRRHARKAGLTTI
jgi:hypothetical protein